MFENTCLIRSAKYGKTIGIRYLSLWEKPKEKLGFLAKMTQNLKNRIEKVFLLTKKNIPIFQVLGHNGFEFLAHKTHFLLTGLFFLVCPHSAGFSSFW